MSLIRNTAWSAVAAIVMSGGRFLITMLLARKLGIIEFGKFAFTQWLVDMVFVSLAFGLNGSASRFFSEFQTQAENLVAFERWFLLRSLSVVMAVAVASPLVAIVFNGETNLKIGLLQAGWSASAAIWALLMARALGLHQFKRVALSNASYVAIALVSSLLLPAQDVSVTEAMLLIMESTAVAALVVWQPLPKPTRMQKAYPFDLNIKILRAFGLNIWITGVVGALVWSRGEVSIVRTVLGVSDLAIYSTALSLVSIGTQGVMLLTGALGPHITQMWGAGKQAEAINLCRRFTDIFTLIAGVLSIFLIVFAPELIYFTFGLAYAGAKVALIILGLGVLGFTSAAANQLLLLKTNGVFGRNVNLISAFSLFVIAIPLVKLVGIDGAAISRAFIQIAVGFTTLFFARHLISVSTVNWVNQAKIGLIIFVVILFNYTNNYNLYIRALAFCLSTLVIILWLRDDNGHLLFGSLLNRGYISLLNKKKRSNIN